MLYMYSRMYLVISGAIVSETMTMIIHLPSPSTPWEKEDHRTTCCDSRIFKAPSPAQSNCPMDSNGTLLLPWLPPAAEELLAMVVLASACIHFHREKTQSEVNPAKPKETHKMLVECGKTEPGALCHQCRRPLAVASQGLTLCKQHTFYMAWRPKWPKLLSRWLYHL